MHERRGGVDIGRMVLVTVILAFILPGLGECSLLNSALMRRDGISRGISNPGVGQCLGFCTADLWCSMLNGLWISWTKTQTFPISRIPDTCTSGYYPLWDLTNTLSVTFVLIWLVFCVYCLLGFTILARRLVFDSLRIWIYWLNSNLFISGKYFIQYLLHRNHIYWYENVV